MAAHKMSIERELSAGGGQNKPDLIRLSPRLHTLTANAAATAILLQLLMLVLLHCYYYYCSYAISNNLNIISTIVITNFTTLTTKISPILVSTCTDLSKPETTRNVSSRVHTILAPLLPSGPGPSYTKKNIVVRINKHKLNKLTLSYKSNKKIKQPL